jgi:hypothetical protein
MCGRCHWCLCYRLRYRNVKKAHAMKSPPSTPVDSHVIHLARFAKVCDGRKQPIRGLWKRNGRYYA